MLRNSPVAFLILALSLIPSSTAFAQQDSGYEIVSLEKNAWVSRKTSSNKVSLLKGDILQNGDTVEILQGNTLDLAFGQDWKNRVHIPSAGILKPDDSGTKKGLFLEKGKLFAQIDGLEPAHTFKVTTPTAVAAVRGTQFQVNTSSGRTLVFNYNGEIEVHSRAGDGPSSQEALTLKAGQKISVDSGPLEVVEMTLEELAEIKSIFKDSAVPAAQTQGAKTPKSKVTQDKKDEMIVESYLEDK